VAWDWVHLATDWPILPVLDDRWWWMWSSRWNENWQGKPKYSEKNWHSATFSTTNPTWTQLGSNPGRRSGKQASNRTAKLNLNNFLYNMCWSFPELWSAASAYFWRHSHPQQQNAFVSNIIVHKNNWHKSSLCDENSTQFISRPERLFWVLLKARVLFMGYTRTKRTFGDWV
jgi:hypothetical protein